ncbi:MAG: hypothetical protein KKH41_03410, partial [Candidatus Thermoplasmatota archaeon]|nr:hypothetical protein [Euryarchaeota archaeon]MBU4071443.1 hypothetical protein [Candidatus Thermoplasmatota archaeon]MBU4143829.1 hypothetical protein [Candidatus Thermoplasmatota archaeon]MBU4591614.1 hypothetical protein [Candidatus Thermoplasmatota archaeon]
MGRNLEKPAWKALVAAMAIAFIVVAGAGIGGSSSVSAEYSTPITSSGTRQNVTNTTISVNGYVFDILEGEPELPPDLIAQPPESGEIGSYIIHICVLITQTEIDAIRNMNITIIGSIPWNAYKVRMTPEQAQLASNLSFVDWVGFFHPAYKISGDLDPGQTDVKIIMYGPEIPDAAIEQVRLKFHTIKSEGFTLDGDYLFQGTLQS